MSRTSPLLRIPAGVASLWTAGAWMRAQIYQGGVFRRNRLRAKVISIGNITWGGTGKTPFTLWLASRLQAGGLRVAILTRGYGRNSREPVKILPPGTTAAQAHDTGDEVQIYLRHLSLPVGISASRYEAGRLIEERFPIDVHLLDDGFQHWGLHRNLDLALVDAENPWGSRFGFPRLLREGPSALRRAHGILLTRCELARELATDRAPLEGLRETLRRLSPNAQIFTVRTSLRHFVAVPGENCIPAEEFLTRRAVAFCAMGNPRNFFLTLEHAGIPVVAQKAFPDHHRYRPQDLRLLEELGRKNQADCFLTTEKDLVNLPPETALTMPLYWAAIEPVVDEETRLLSWICEQLDLPPERLSANSNPAADTEELKATANR